MNKRDELITDLQLKAIEISELDSPEGENHYLLMCYDTKREAFSMYEGFDEYTLFAMFSCLLDEQNDNKHLYSDAILLVFADIVIGVSDERFNTIFDVIKKQRSLLKGESI